MTGISKGSFEVYQYLTEERQIRVYRSIICDFNVQIEYARGVSDKLITRNTSPEDKIMVVSSSKRYLCGFVPNSKRF